MYGSAQESQHTYCSLRQKHRIGLFTLDRLKTRGTSQAMMRSVLGDEILKELGLCLDLLWWSPRHLYRNTASSLALTRQPFSFINLQHSAASAHGLQPGQFATSYCWVAFSTCFNLFYLNWAAMDQIS